MNLKCFNLHSRVILYLVMGSLMPFLIALAAKSGCAPSSYPRPVPIGIYNAPIGAMNGVVQGQIAFLGEVGNVVGRLSSIDVSNPSRPQEIGDTDIVGLYPMGIAIHQNYIYIVSQGENPETSYFEIFDVSLPDSPQPVGILSLNASLVAVAAKDDIAYISDDTTGDVLVIDVSDPTDPIYLRSVNTELIVFSIFVHENLAFLANSGLGLSVLDITTPSNPVFLSTLNPGNEEVIYDVKAKEQYAYTTYATPSPTNQLLVVDASNPEQMEIVNSVEVDTMARGVALDGSIIAVTIQETLSHGSVLLVDINDPISPQKGGSANVPDGGPQGPVVIQDNLVYVVSVGGLAIYEIVYE